MSDTQTTEPKKTAKPKQNAPAKEYPKPEEQNDNDLKTNKQTKVAAKKRPLNKVNKQIDSLKTIQESNTVEKPRKRRSKKEMMLAATSAAGLQGNQHMLKPKTPAKVRVSKNDIEIKEEASENIEDFNPNEIITWPQPNMSELIKRIEAALPDKDNLVYSTRAEKLNWDDIAFKEYSGDECKKMWLIIQKRLRRFRVLSEVLQDAKEWISKPWTNFYKGPKAQRHPDLPRRPLSVYMLFYLKKKDKMLAENAGLDITELSKKIALMYKNISPAKKEKYMQLAEDERKKYEEKLEEFYRIHPELSRSIDKPARSKVDNRPKKPSTPYALYFEEQLKNFASDSEIDRNAFKEQCKEQWRNLTDKKKVIWIDWALEKEAKYQNELKDYLTQNPDSVPVATKNAKTKTVLTKDEKLLKERLSGKPIKPPSSAYGLFSKMLLQSDEIKNVNTQDRMKLIADQWKNSSEDEKKAYRERLEQLTEQYKLDFATYLESLPEDKRQEALQSNLPKRKMKASENGEGPRKKMKKNIAKKEASVDKIFDTEPPQPSVDGFALFSKRYHGKAPVETAWKNLNKLEKKEYEVEVQKLKLKYIKEYKKFLKSLTKEQLTTFSQLKQKRESMDAADGNNERSEEYSNSCDSDSSEESSDLGQD